MAVFLGFNRGFFRPTLLSRSLCVPGSRCFFRVPGSLPVVFHAGFYLGLYGRFLCKLVCWRFTSVFGGAFPLYAALRVAWCAALAVFPRPVVDTRSHYHPP